MWLVHFWARLRFSWAKSDVADKRSWLPAANHQDAYTPLVPPSGRPDQVEAMRPPVAVVHRVYPNRWDQHTLVDEY